VLAFPGVFRSALDVRAAAISNQMKLAAAHTLAAQVREDELHAKYIIPSVFNRDVAPAVAGAVAHAAEASGVAQRPGAEQRL
jgi:malate dehydrogenase (oxaloacetate-decarboxylating)